MNDRFTSKADIEATQTDADIGEARVIDLSHGL
jgi:hypothetical protein